MDTILTHHTELLCSASIQTVLKENIAACNSPCFWWQLLTVWSHVCLTCADIITNIYMVGELTAIKTDKLGGETV